MGQMKTVNPLCAAQACQDQADMNYEQALEAIRQEFNIPVSEWQKMHEEFLSTCTANQNLFIGPENLNQKTARGEFVEPFERKSKACTLRSSLRQEGFGGHGKLWTFSPEQGQGGQGERVEKNLIRNALANAGVNPDRVSINYTADSSMPVVTYQEYISKNHLKHSISINKKWFTKQPIELQNGIINHEIQHLKNFDCIEYGFITECLERHGVSQQQMDTSHSLQNFRHMRELRADLLAGSCDINVANALHQDFCNCVAQNYQEDESSHPSSQTRLDQMAQLLNRMRLEQSIKLA